MNGQFATGLSNHSFYLINLIDSCQENSKTRVCFGQSSTIVDVLFTNDQNIIHE